jgi:hypothetical protein
MQIPFEVDPPEKVEKGADKSETVNPQNPQSSQSSQEQASKLVRSHYC